MVPSIKPTPASTKLLGAFFILVISLLNAGCGSSNPETPEDISAAFIEAIFQNDGAFVDRYSTPGMKRGTNDKLKWLFTVAPHRVPKSYDITVDNFVESQPDMGRVHYQIDLITQNGAPKSFKGSLALQKHEGQWLVHGPGNVISSL
ncbi:hypothetical protein [Allohahella marinimesophila]|uniref:DUF4878 domain-containing protein n=1 Tax=Allohahella marinimesophila TaxID=1054972 RepID=A0ABP7PYM0_9GAMM